jgi:hypothetical protein
MDDVVFGDWAGNTGQAWTEAGHQPCGSWWAEPGHPTMCSCGDVLVRVEWAHIDDAGLSPARNPVALAIRDAFPGSTWPVAGANTAYLTRGGWREERPMPHGARLFLAAFYAGSLVRPFNFSLPGTPEFRYRFVLARPRNTASRARKILAAETGDAA